MFRHPASSTHKWWPTRRAEPSHLKGAAAARPEGATRQATAEVPHAGAPVIVKRPQDQKSRPLLGPGRLTVRFCSGGSGGKGVAHARLGRTEFSGLLTWGHTSMSAGWLHVCWPGRLAWKRRGQAGWRSLLLGTCTNARQHLDYPRLPAPPCPALPRPPAACLGACPTVAAAVPGAAVVKHPFLCGASRLLGLAVAAAAQGAAGGQAEQGALPRGRKQRPRWAYAGLLWAKSRQGRTPGVRRPAGLPGRRHPSSLRRPTAPCRPATPATCQHPFPPV